MRITRTLYVLAAIALAPPALAADVSYRDVSRERAPARSSEAAKVVVSTSEREAKADRELYCSCTPQMHEGTRAPQPRQVEFTDQG